jgi:hypothetical protein
VLSGSYRGFEVLYVEVWRGRDLDQVDVFGVRQLLERVRPFEQQLAFDLRLIEAGKYFVEVFVAGSKLVGEDVGESDDSGRGVSRE